MGTLKRLYQLITGDLASHQRAIDGRYRKLDERTRRIVRARVDGESIYAIGPREGVSAGTVDKLIRRAMERIRKELAGEPRYNRTGHSSGVQPRRSRSRV